ncbi:MAG TPA: DUF922 domain-containing protein [Bacteroidia bacterium]|nr:DUF922 domain-containing protein [Bacteroidia bacterium]
MRFYFIILLLVSFGNTAFMPDGEKEEVIVWQKNRKLTWDDYQGKRQKRFAAASTVYSMYRHISKTPSGDIIATVKAYFYPKDSWKSSWIDDALLAHEQKHFDIVELYARKLRKQLTQIKVRNEADAEQKLDSIHKIIDAEMDAFQDKYDDETDYSMAHDPQISWIKKIDAAIDNLSAYQNPEVKLKTAF